MTGLLPWLALGAALSPAVVEWVLHVMVAEPAKSWVLLAPFWIAWASREVEPTAPRRSGLLGIVGALGLQWLALLAGPAALGRLALPLGLLGMARRLGHPPLRVALMAVWLVPLPHALLSRTSPELPALVLQVAAWPLQAAGVDLAVLGREAAVGGTRILLGPEEGGLAGAWALAGVGWFAGLRLRGSAVAAPCGAVLGAAAALPVQVVAVSLTLCAAAAGAPEAAPALHSALWPFVVVSATVGVGLARSRGRAALSTNA